MVEVTISFGNWGSDRISSKSPQSYRSDYPEARMAAQLVNSDEWGDGPKDFESFIRHRPGQPLGPTPRVYAT